MPIRWLGLAFAVGCGSPTSNARVSEEQANVEQREDATAESVSTSCRTDNDCTLGTYFNEEAGCCPPIAGASCVASVMTRSEAEANREAWLEHCEGVSCPPSASCAIGIWDPVPKCSDGVCVDVGKPREQRATEAVQPKDPPVADVPSTPLDSSTGDKQLIPCTGNHGNVLKCGSDRIDGIRVSPAGDGTFHRVAWRQHFGSDKRWRETALYDTGMIHFIFDPGQQNASKWKTLSEWIFPRTQRIQVLRHPGTLKFEVVDSSGVRWALSGNKIGPYLHTFVITVVDGVPQQLPAPSATDRGIVGVDFSSWKPFWLEHKVLSYSPYADQKEPRYTNKKSIFHDQRGRVCQVVNERLFGDRKTRHTGHGRFLFHTDAELLRFLSVQCPKLDLKPLRDAKPPTAVPPRRFNKGLTR